MRQKIVFHSNLREMNRKNPIEQEKQRVSNIYTNRFTKTYLLSMIIG